MVPFAAIVAFVLHATRAATCGPPPQQVAMLTAADATISAGGGVIVEIDTGKLPAWSRHGGAALPATAFTKLAPGLFRIAVPATGTLALDGDDHAALAHVTRAAAGHDDPPVAAPDIVLADYTATAGRNGGEYVEVHVDANPPDGVIALVLYGVGKRGNVARSWIAIDRRSGSTFMAYGKGRCVVDRPGTIASHAGDRIAAAWVDASGRVSALSKPWTVRVARDEVGGE